MRSLISPKDPNHKLGVLRHPQSLRKESKKWLKPASLRKSMRHERLVSKLKNKGVKASYNSFRTASRFVTLDSQPFAVFFLQRKRSRSTRELLFWRGPWEFRHFGPFNTGTSKNHRILEAQDPVSSNIDPKQRTSKQYVADTCHAADLLL